MVLQTYSNVEKLLLRCIKLWFSFTSPLSYRKSFTISILPPSPKLHRSQIDAVLVLESGIKLALHYDFLYRRGKVRENQTLIHLSERFWTLKNVCKSGQSSGKWSFHKKQKKGESLKETHVLLLSLAFCYLRFISLPHISQQVAANTRQGSMQLSQFLAVIDLWSRRKHKHRKKTLLLRLFIVERGQSK